MSLVKFNWVKQLFGDLNSRSEDESKPKSPNLTFLTFVIARHKREANFNYQNQCQLEESCRVSHKSHGEAERERHSRQIEL